MILRAIGLVKEVYDWISFSEQAFSWLGLAQRAAAVAAGAAVVAAPIVVATKPWQPLIQAGKKFSGLAVGKKSRQLFGRTFRHNPVYIPV